MRQLTVLLALACMWIPPVAAENVRIAAWDLEGCEIGSAETLASEPGQKRLRQVAASLRSVNADVIVLRGIPDRQVALFLTASLQPSTYHIALHSSMRKSRATTTGPSLTVLSKKPAFSTQTTEWRTLGQTDLPGGFAFAGINFGPGALCVYAADLPRDPGNIAGDPNSALTLRRREVAAQHLAHHARSLGTTPTGQTPSFLLIADLFTGTRAAPPEAAVRTLQQAGFKVAAATRTLTKRRGYSGEELDLPPLFSAFLARNAEFLTTPQVPMRKGINQPISAFDLTLPNASFPDGGLGLAFSKIAATRTASKNPLDTWLWAGGLCLLSVMISLSVWIFRRSSPPERIFARAHEARFGVPPDGFTADQEPSGPRTTRGRPEASPGEEERDPRASRWQREAAHAEEKAVQDGAMVRAGVAGQLKRLMRERLISWLSLQRSALLASHEAGTQQVIELDQRLQRLHAEFEGRLHEREHRIAELEQDLAARERVIRDLMRSQVSLADRSEEQ